MFWRRSGYLISNDGGRCDMGYRYRNARPRLALWMLVALGDVALLLISVGLPVLVALLGVVAITLGAVGVRRLSGPLCKSFGGYAAGVSAAGW
jgi:hypothetical protein